MRKSQSSSSREASALAEKQSTRVRDIQNARIENKICFDCGQRGPTYVNMTLGSFVCTRCSGMLRGINPPHRIKSISMSSFSEDEIDFLRHRGNLWVSKVWLGLYGKEWDKNFPADDEAIREFVVQKYERKRYYVDPSTISEVLSAITAKSAGGGRSVGSSLQKPGIQLIGSTLNARLKNQSSTSISSFPGSSSVSSPAVAAITTSPAIPRTPPQQSGIAEDPFAAFKASSATSAFATPTQQKPPAMAAFLPSINGPKQQANNMNSVAAATVTPAVSSSPAASAFEANFANFDAANFDSLPTDNPSSRESQSKSTTTAFETAFTPPMMTGLQQQQPQTSNSSSILQPSNSAMKKSSNPGTTTTDPFGGSAWPPQTQSSQMLSSGSKPSLTKTPPKEDRYAALKDLDEIFKSSSLGDNSSPVTVPGGSTTGASIFGSSAAPATSDGTPIASSGIGLFDATSIASEPPKNSNNGSLFSVSDWGTSPSSASKTNNGIFGATDFTVTGQNRLDIDGATNVTSPPVNPFTGASPSNLSTLNTSPWPTTGTSPVQQRPTDSNAIKTNNASGNGINESSSNVNDFFPTNWSTIPSSSATSSSVSGFQNDPFANLANGSTTISSLTKTGASVSSNLAPPPAFDNFFNQIQSGASSNENNKENNNSSSGGFNDPWTTTMANGNGAVVSTPSSSSVKKATQGSTNPFL